MVFKTVMMRINPVLTTPKILQNNVPRSLNKPQTRETTKLSDMPYYVNFGQLNTEDFNPFDYFKLQLETQPKKYITMKELEKNEGIQKGIKVFEGLTLKEIAFIAQNLIEVAVYRGCRNNCAHCYANGKPAIKETPNQIAKMSWEDFCSMTDGFQELNNRLGYSIFNKKSDNTPYLTAFHDADSSDVRLTDKNGNEHGYMEIAKKLYEASGIKVIFDTSGWYLEDKAAQKRVEKVVETIVKEKPEYLWDANISLNPFHAMHKKALEHYNKNDDKGGDFLEDRNYDRMANVFFTLTPLQDINYLRFIPRAMSDTALAVDGYRENDLKIMLNNIFDRLEKLYEADFNGPQKVIHKKSDIQRYLKQFSQNYRTIQTDLGVAGRLENLYYETDPIAQESRFLMRHQETAPFEYPYYGIIDANGDYYLTNYYETYKTDIKLNFENKSKITRQIEPNLNDIVITKNMIIGNPLP